MSMLTPYRVLDLTNNGALICGQILADLGADVIAVEPPGGSPARRIGPFRGDQRDPDDSLFWWSYSRDKRSVVLDLETDEGRARFRPLVQTADFVIESFPPRYLDRLGLGWATLSALNPRLVMVSITPFGQQGPKAEWAATDLVMQAASGVLLLTGDEDRPPVRLPYEQAYLHVGAEAAVGALIAHTARERDAVGQHVDVSVQTAAMIATQSAVLTWGWDKNLKFTRSAGGVRSGRLVSRFIYPCQDGYVSVSFLFGPVMGPYTQRLFEWMHEKGYVDEATRDKNWVEYLTLLRKRQEPVSEVDRCQAAIERFTRAHTKAELAAEAEKRRLLIMPVSTTADLASSPQLEARAFWTEVEFPELGRRVKYPGPFAKLSLTPIRYRRRPPRVGEHTAAVFADVDRRLAMPPPPAALSVSLEVQPALAGLKVLDFSWVFATPMAVRYLSDHGATVVHVESATRPDALRTWAPFMNRRPGPDSSAQFANVQAGKLGLSLNLTKPRGRDIALRLVKWADVVVESFSPKAMRNWNMHYEALRELNPGLVMISSCLNGQTGPGAMLAGFGTMGVQMAGLGAVVGWPDRPPSGPYSAYTDYTSPKMIASALLAALDHRRRTGEGQYIDYSQVEGSIHFLTPAVLDYVVNGRVQERAGNASAQHAPHGVYRCVGEDRWVAIACATEAQWKALGTVAGHPEWVADARFATFAARQANAGALDASIAAWTAPQEVAALERALQGAGVPAHRALNTEEAFIDPQLLFRQHFIDVTHVSLGTVRIESSRLRLSRTPAQTTAAGPTFGEHNNQVLQDILGMDEDEIVEVLESGALA